MKVILFCKEKLGLNEVINYLEINSKELQIYKGKVDDPFPKIKCDEIIDLLISFYSPWIIPKNILNRVKLYAINFHPGPPEYRGIGCANYAIYNDEKSYGVTAHIMNTKVDSGDIINVKRFSIHENDNLLTITQKCYTYILIQYYEIISKIFNGEKIKLLNTKWGIKLYKRKDLIELCRIIPDMNKNEIGKRIKATSFPGFQGAYIELQGYKFNFQEEK